MGSPWAKKDLEFLGALGRPGSFGTVFKAKDENGKFAVKQISVEGFLYKSGVLRQNSHTREPLIVLKREAKFLRSLNHDNVVKYFDCWFEGPQSEQLEAEDSVAGMEASLEPQVSSGSSTISGNNFFYIKMEFGGDLTLEKWISSRPTQQQRDDDLQSIHEIFYQLLKGMKYIQEKSLVHRDLKPDNIFINNTTQPFALKIGDFGLARYVNAAASVSKFTVGVGATRYRSPEVDVDSDGKYDTKSDMYSLGLIFLETLCALEDPPGGTHDLVKWRNGYQVEKFYDMKTKYPIHMDLITKMTFKDSPTTRPSASEIITEIFTRAKNQNVEYFQARPQWYTSFLTPPQYLTPSSGLVDFTDEFLKEARNGKYFWNSHKDAINRPTCVYIGTEEDLVNLKKYFLRQKQFFVEVVYLQKQTGISATEDYRKSSFRFTFDESQQLVSDETRKSDTLAATVLGKLATAKRNLMGSSERDGDYLKDYSVVHFMMKAFPVVVTIRSDTNIHKTTMEFDHFMKEQGKPPVLFYWRVRSISTDIKKKENGTRNSQPVLHLRHLEFSTPAELLYHLHDGIEMFKKLQNGFTLNEKQRTRIQPAAGYDYDSSSYLDLQFYDEKSFAESDSAQQKSDCCIV